MKISTIKLSEAINKVISFNPIKIVLNDVVVYNDYDGEIGEKEDFLPLLPKRIDNYNNLFVKDIKIEIVEFHHSIV